MTQEQIATAIRLIEKKAWAEEVSVKECFYFNQVECRSYDIDELKSMLK